MLGVSVGTARKLNVAPVYYTYRIPVVASFVFVVLGATDKADYGLERSPKASLFLFGIRVCLKWSQHPKTWGTPPRTFKRKKRYPFLDGSSQVSQ